MAKQYDIKWGEIGYLSYKRTYSRKLKGNKTEEFHDTVERIVKACNTQLKVGFTDAEEDFVRYMMCQMKGSVAGRFLWQLGTNTVTKLGLASLQNCAGVVIDHPIRPFTWTMDMLMLGCGVGYNLQREFIYEIKEKIKRARIVRQDTKDADFIVPDSREGWVELLRRVLEAHFYTGRSFSYSTICIRGKGAPIKSFGGVASGPEELCWGIEQISTVLNRRAGKKLRPIDALDIMNIIGYIVVAGNVRRSAQIALGDCDDLQYLNAKRWDLGGIPNWRAMSNNSVVCNDISNLPEQFWQGYEGNGEPYGLINLKTSREVGRTGDTAYPDKDVSVYNPCVSGDTLILTEHGHLPIANLVEGELLQQQGYIKVWNGAEWSKVIPRITGYNQPMVTVQLSDGKSLRCTYAHKWILADGERVEAKHLQQGMKLAKFDCPVIEGYESYKHSAYTQGFYSGDGNSSKKAIWLYSPKYICESRLDCQSVVREYPTRNPEIQRKFICPSFDLLDKNFVPSATWLLQDRLDWFAGLCDADATLTKDGNLQLGSINRKFLLDVQLMLMSCGVNSKISIMHKAGKRALPGGTYYCNTSYRLMLSAYSVKKLSNLGMYCERLNIEEVEPNRDASRFITVDAVIADGTEDIVYCFTEPLNNTGIFNGIMTGQCAEQSLANFETCCLAEIYLPNVVSAAELFDVAKTLYRINKHSLALKCHHPETQAIVHKNMRMGIGVTGYLQATEEQRSWLKDCYTALREFDQQYSEQHNWPCSIKLFTVKPSGTLSLLAGVTPGVHPGYSQYFIRRIRMAADADLVNACRANGYHVEPVKNFDGTNDPNTVVVEFPCSFPEGTILAENMTAIQQLEYVKRLQAEWSDNSVSCTVYYRKEELPQIREWLTKHYNNNCKTLSFLLHSEHGFIQAPYEPITKEQYEELKKKVKPITSIEVSEDEMELDACESGHCPVK